VFALNEFEHFSPSTSLGEWCETNGDFTRDVRNRIDQYFARATHMRGFCTAPLLVPTADFEPRAIDRKVLGVLNIHWSNAKLLEREETAKAFCEAIFPIRALISQQILRLHAAGWILPSPPLDATPTPTSTPRPISTPSSGWPRPVVQ
jgi:hypothetical protein